MDKAGNFIGWLHIEGVNLSVALVEHALSKVHFTAERSPYSKALLAAEEAAKQRKEKVSGPLCHRAGPDAPRDPRRWPRACGRGLDARPSPVPCPPPRCGPTTRRRRWRRWCRCWRRRSARPTTSPSSSRRSRTTCTSTCRTWRQVRGGSSTVGTGSLLRAPPPRAAGFHCSPPPATEGGCFHYKKGRLN